MVNSDLSNINKWSEDWLITFNPDKTDIMLFDSRRQGNRSSLDNDTRNTTTFDTFKINLKSKVILAKIPAHFLVGIEYPIYYMRRVVDLSGRTLPTFS